MGRVVKGCKRESTDVAFHTQLLEVLIPIMGVAKSEGFPLDALMGFVGACFGNANAEVRAAAVRVTILVRSLRLHPAFFFASFEAHRQCCRSRVS